MPALPTAPPGPSRPAPRARAGGVRPPAAVSYTTLKKKKKKTKQRITHNNIIKQ
ncbi:hypothetical protein [Streptomyces alfalfae]